ncbi:winged helix-turn-helix transcriptional regulator [Patescibacteria group bacterium]|nr:winged helix-turn-helix transcriptional regulator [Patescibacteria group bacterium]
MLTKERITKIKQGTLHENEKLPRVFTALSDPGRFRMFKLLTQHTGLCVTEVANIFGISVPAASHQLRMLEMCGLIQRERLGQMICYKIKNNDPVVKSIIKLVGAKLST